MASASPTRPSRRATVQRKILADDSDEENAVAPTRDAEKDEEFAPAPARSPRRPGRRKTTHALEPTTPKTSGRARRMKTGDSIVPSEIFSPEQTPLPESPSKKASPRKRKNTVPARKPRASVAPEVPPLPTPKPSTSPEPTQAQSTPLADVTSAKVNVQQAGPEPQKEFVKFEPADTVLEKPMDIVIRTRAQGIPHVPLDTTPKPRLMIRYLVLQNFKSYSGRQEVGPFHHSFSSVVGPNGSGKSNVIDSLLFVFGFRASKMRQSKLSALIHHSAAHPDLDSCEVEVHFQEIQDLRGGKMEVMPRSDLVISRKAFKNNSSKYYVNKRESNYTDVTALLRAKGIDLDHKRFLILQGEVESIAQMKPKAANEHDDGLLEYLEDIIGTSKYKQPIEEAAVEVETLNEVCVEKNSRVQHVEKEKNSLEDKKNKALAYIRNENELAYKQSALYQVYTEECNCNLKVTEEAIAQMQAQLDEELGKHRGSEDEIKQLEKTIKKGQKEHETLEKTTQGVLKEVAKYDKEKVKFEEKKKFLTNKEKKLEKSLQSSRLSASEATSLIKRYADDIDRVSGEIVELEKELKIEERDLSKIRESLKGKTQGLSNEIAAKQKSLEPWNQKISEKQSAVAVAQSEVDLLRKKASAGAEAITEAEAKVEAVKAQSRQKHSEVEKIRKEKGQAENEINTLKQELEKHSKKEPEFRTRVSSARQKADDARATLSNSQSQGNVLSGLMRLKESGRVEGFHGRLGNLGAIDQKYDVAISTACPQLDNLVVDTVETGQQCIDYLRKNNLGRANIVLLDRLAKRDLSTIQTPENVPRLFDLIKAKNDKFRPAFFSVLQNTLVANDLEQANRIAYGVRRWRVVTLDGQLIDVSGTMSGGGTRVARGGMSSKLAADVTKEQVVKFELDRDTLEKQLGEFQGKQRELEVSVGDLETRLPQLDTTLQKLELEIASSEDNLADAQRRVTELKAETTDSQSDDSKLAALEKQITQLEKEIGKLHKQSAGLEQEIKDLQDKIMEIGGIQLRSQKAKVDGLKDQISTLNDEISNAEVSKSKAEKDKIKYEKAFQQSEKDLASASEELKQLDDEANGQLADVTKLRQQADEAQSELENKKEELDGVKQQLDKRRASLNETRGIEIEMKNKLEENQRVLTDNEKRLRYWSEKLGKLSLQDVEGLGDDEVQKEAEQLPQYTVDELQDMDKDTLKAEIAAIEEKVQKASVDLDVLREYRRRVAEHSERSADLQTAVSSRDTVKKRLDDLRRLRLEGFMEGFSIISLRLKEMYQMITMGGNAELELVDSLDPFSEGILFSVMPPKKSWKNISNLSGGEKTLSSLALVFAMQVYAPTPLYVMDEIDAALDFKNVSIIAEYIRSRTRNAQFLVISLRNNMFELASRLVGVYKVNNQTKSVTIENKDYFRR